MSRLVFCRKLFQNLQTQKKILNFLRSQVTSAATTDKIFKKQDDFQARHIGPREHEQTQMLELLGFRVSIYLNQTNNYRIIKL